VEEKLKALIREEYGVKTQPSTTVPLAAPFSLQVFLSRLKGKKRGRLSCSKNMVAK
jgi:hypothetical protein